MERFKVVAPTRADLAGGTLDLWPLYCSLGGVKTINVALDLKAIAAFEYLPSVAFECEVQSGNSEPYTFDEPLTLEAAKKLSPALQFPVAVISRFLQQQPFLPEKKLKMTLATEAPLRSGLGGSSALCVAMVRGLSRIFGQFTDQGWQWDLLNWVKDMEASYLNTPTGTQDYLAALFGGLAAYTSEIGKSERLTYPTKTFDGLSQRLLVLFSGEMHHSGMSNWEVFKAAMENNQEVWRGLAGIKGVADSLDEELRSPNLDWKAVGKLLSEEWRIRKSTFRVHTERLDENCIFPKQ